MHTRQVSSNFALLCFLFRKQKYLDIAVAHHLEVNLKAPDLRRRYEQGKFPEIGWEVEARKSADESAIALKSSMSKALKDTIVFAAFGLVVAASFGKINPNLPVDIGKVFSLGGGLVAAWATLFELGHYAVTWKGNALHELIRPKIFKFSFLFGLSFATLGQVWWQ